MLAKIRCVSSRHLFRRSVICSRTLLVVVTVAAVTMIPRVALPELRPIILDMLENLGYRIPGDIGLATPSIHDTPIDAGIDQRPYEIGRTAIRILTALIAERSFGIPDCRSETLIEGTRGTAPCCRREGDIRFTCTHRFFTPAHCVHFVEASRNNNSQSE